MTKKELLNKALEINIKREQIAQLNREIEAINEAVEHASITQKDFDTYVSMSIDEFGLLKNEVIK